MLQNKLILDNSETEVLIVVIKDQRKYTDNITVRVGSTCTGTEVLKCAHILSVLLDEER